MAYALSSATSVVGKDSATGISTAAKMREGRIHFSTIASDVDISVNVGTVDGGLGANVVAPEATAQIETRVETAEDAVAVEEAIKGLAPTKEECVIEVEGSFRRPPLEKTPGNRLLWEEAVAAAGEMGLALGEASVGGASDGNLTSTVTATLDGLGAVGDGAHAEYEHLVVEKLPERAALLAALLTRPLVQ